MDKYLVFDLLEKRFHNKADSCRESAIAPGNSVRYNSLSQTADIFDEIAYSIALVVQEARQESEKS